MNAFVDTPAGLVHVQTAPKGVPLSSLFAAITQAPDIKNAALDSINLVIYRSKQPFGTSVEPPRGRPALATAQLKTGHELLYHSNH